jgi:hypothetical protein
MNSCSRAQACAGIKPCDASFRDAANSTATAKAARHPKRRSEAQTQLQMKIFVSAIVEVVTIMPRPSLKEAHPCDAGAESIQSKLTLRL